MLISTHETVKLLVNSFPLHTVPQPMTVDSSSLLATQAPPDMLLGSEEGEKKTSPTAPATDVTSGDPPPVEGASDNTKDSEQMTEKDGVADGGAVEKVESVEKEPQVVENSTKSTEVADDQASASADNEPVEAMETDTQQAGTDTGGENDKSGESEQSPSGGDGASESQQTPPTDAVANNDTATSEADVTVEEAKGEQVNEETPPEVEGKELSESTEAPKEDIVAVSSSPCGEEPVISEPMMTTGESMEREGEETTQGGEEQQEQVIMST